MEDGAMTAVGSEETVVPESELKKALARIRDLKRALGKSTMKVEVLKEAVRIGREKNSSPKSHWWVWGKVPFKMQWLTNNGPGFVARETVFFGRSLGLEMCTTAPYSPESNGMTEAFVKT